MNNTHKKVAHLGLAGSNSYTAALKQYGDDVLLQGYATFPELFNAVVKGTVDEGIIPIENSLAGSIFENYDLLHAHDVMVTGEYYLKFENHLMSILVDGVTDAQRMNMIKKVISHYQPLAQCSGFLSRHPWMERMVFSDTAAAAKYVKEQDNPSLGAIANADASRIYGLKILRENIADTTDNYTRFLTIAHHHHAISHANKCSMALSLAHKPGSLVKVLQLLAHHGLNLTKIESRPIPHKPFEYVFYIDFEHDSLTKSLVHDIEKEMKAHTDWVHILGIYRAMPRPV